MIINGNTGVGSFLYNISKIRERMDTAIRQISSGKRVTRPSDDPSGMSNIMNLKKLTDQGQQYIRNIDQSLTFMHMTDSVLQHLDNLIIEAKSLAMEAASSTVSSDARQAIAEEIDSIKNEILSLSNTKILGKYIFSGTKTLTKPFEDTGGTVVYQGNTDSVQIQMGKETPVSINLTGDQVFQNDDDIFDVMSDLSNALKSNDSDGIANSLDRLETSLNQVLRYRTVIGKRINLVDNTKQRLEEFNLIAAGEISNLEDADIAEAITNFMKEQIALDASLGAGGRIFTQSLLDYLG